MRRIATEEAFVIPEVLRPMLDRAAGEPYDSDLFFWSKAADGTPLQRRLLDLDDERLQIMDETGIDVQLISLASTGVQMFPADEATALATLANDVLADAIARHPARYAGLASFAPQDPAGAAREIERAMTRLGYNGVIVNSHTNGDYLDQPEYWPILEACEATGAPLYIHPRAPSPQMIAPYQAYTLEHAIWGFQAETSLHALRLIAGGIFDRFPRLQVVLGHGGEGLHYWLPRLDAMHANFKAPEGSRPALELAPSEYIKRNFAITTSGMNWGPAVRFAIESIGADKVMFAIDYPFVDSGKSVAEMEAIDLPAEVKAAIWHRNAERIFNIAPKG
ncbi:amidohydrolase family protein [Sphingomonas canadensis]|uniref:Amidohydrolase family protein n=1 Tax=Sphingomonas canadensis TaxID=1219257 RepID=A0ABW3HAU8_9SPHN|nr:amidohydrolase family protein [Sphingomonas canadensis]MCW3838316.1 amidohydrolase family protein [Sphingomonas canadensis]